MIAMLLVKEVTLDSGTDRVLTSIVIDERTDKTTTYADAIKSVTQA